MQQENIITVEYMDDTERIADFCNVLYFSGKQVVSPEDVREMDKEVRLIRKKRRKIFTRALYRDILCKVVLGVRHLIIGIEHQSQIDDAMPIRIMEYDAGAYGRQLRKIRKDHRKRRDLKGAPYVAGFSNKDYIAPVLTTLLYFGKEPWSGPRDIHGLIKLEGSFESLKDVIPNYTINIVEVRNYSHWKSFKSDLREIFGYLQHLTEEKSILAYVPENREAYENLPEAAYDLLSTVTNASELKALKKQYQDKGGNVNMCEVLQQLIKDGWNEGLQIGEETRNIALICKKLDRGLSIEDISYWMELDREYVQKISKLHENYPSCNADSLRRHAESDKSFLPENQR